MIYFQDGLGFWITWAEEARLCRHDENPGYVQRYNWHRKLNLFEGLIDACNINLRSSKLLEERWHRWIDPKQSHFLRRLVILLGNLYTTRDMSDHMDQWRARIDHCCRMICLFNRLQIWSTLQRILMKQRLVRSDLRWEPSSLPLTSKRDPEVRHLYLRETPMGTVKWYSQIIGFQRFL